MLSHENRGAYASREIVGAPKVRATLLRASVTGLLCMGFAISACDPFTVMNEQDPETLEAYYSGCHTVYEGPVCELPEFSEDTEQKLTFWVAGHEAPTIQFNSERGEEELIPELIKTEDGLRFQLVTPEQAGTYTFQISQPQERTWSLEVQPYESRHPVLLEAGDLRKARKHAQVKSILEKALPSLSLRDQGEALSLLGRTELNLGNPESAVERLEEASTVHLQAGNLSAPIRDTTTYSYTYMFSLGLRFDLARKHTTAFGGILPQHYESQHFYHWSQARISQRSGDHRNALAHAERGRKLGQRLGNEKLQGYINHEYSNTLQNLGRFHESAAIFRERVQRISWENPQCEDAIHLNGLGWAQYLLRRNLQNDISTMGYQSQNLPDPQTHFERALAIARTPGTCRKQQAEDTNSLINLALIALDKEDLHAAETYISEAINNGPHRKVYQLWLEQIQAKLALAQNNPAKALKHFDQLLTLSETTKDPYPYWLALTGKASTLAHQNNHEAAQQLWTKAQDLVERESLHAPIHSGRADFLSERQHATQSYVESLLHVGQVQLALQAIHRSRSQLLQGLQWSRKVENLKGSQRTQWELALANYQTSRAKLRELKENLWQVARHDLEAEKEKINRFSAEVSRNLDHTFASLGLSRDVRAPLNISNALDDKEIELTYFKLKDRWVGFLATNEAIFYKSLGTLPAHANNQELAETLLIPFKSNILNATLISLKPWGILRQVDFHALPLEGVPLISYAAVKYSLGLAKTQKQKSTPIVAVVVSDPSGNLSQAREEAKAVIGLLHDQAPMTVEHIENTDATVQRVALALNKADIFHYAGHGKFGADTMSQSSLVLANNTHLSVGDILSLTKAPDHVVLSACESARTNTAAPLEVLGLSQAFALAGSQTVIASSRPVEDKLSRYITTQLYESYQTNQDFSASLREAQLQAKKAFPNADWSTFRIITPN